MRAELFDEEVFAPLMPELLLPVRGCNPGLEDDALHALPLEALYCAAAGRMSTIPAKAAVARIMVFFIG